MKPTKQYKNIPNRMFRRYVSTYTVYILRIVELGNLFNSKYQVEIYDLYGNKTVITKQELLKSYLTPRFKRLKLYKFRNNTSYIVLKKEQSNVYGCYVGHKVQSKSKFRQLNGNGDIYIVCGTKEDDKIDRYNYFSIDKRLFRSLYRKSSSDVAFEANKITRTTNNISNTKKSKTVIDNTPIIQNVPNTPTNETVQTSLTVTHRLVEQGTNKLVGFKLKQDVNGVSSVIDVTVSELMNLCDKRKDVNVVNASTREVDGKRYLYGLGVSLKELPNVYV